MSAAVEEKCFALCDFEASRSDELSFKKGDVITVIAKGKDSGFWEGLLGGQRGLFPNCFVSSNMHPNRNLTFTDKAVAIFAYNPQSASELSMRKHDLITVVKPGNSPGWWYGLNETETQRQVKEGAAPDPQPRLFPANYVTCNLARTMYPFAGRQRCELSMRTGDIILIHRKWNDGWWEGSSVNHDGSALQSAPSKNQQPSPPSTSGFVVGGLRRGIFPSNYTMSNVPTLDPPMFCGKCRTVYQPKGQGVCRECIRNEEIVKTMHATLDDRAQGRDVDPSAKFDLFANIDIDPAKGAGALLPPQADVTKDGQTVRPRLAV